MKNNIDNKNLEEWSDNSSLDGLTPEEIAKKFDKQMDKLKEIAKAEAMDNNETSDDLIGKIDDFFDRGKEEFKEIDTTEEEITFENYQKISDRNITIQKAILESWNNVLDEISDWEKQKSTVSKVLLRVTDWILKTEK